MANALLALVSNSRNVNPYFAICQKTISGATSRWSFFLPFWAVYSRGVRGGGRLFAQLTTCREDLSNKPFSRDCWGSPYFAFAQYGLLVALFRFRSIRAFGRPISLSLNTGSWSPYFAFAQYGLLVALFRFRSIRALAPAMCSGCGPCAHTPAAARLLPDGEYAEPMPIGNAQAGGYRIEIVELSTFYLISRLNRL